MNDVWFSFAETGKPCPQRCGLAEWPCYTADDHACMVINEKAWEIERGGNDKNIGLFTPMYEKALL